MKRERSVEDEIGTSDEDVRMKVDIVLRTPLLDRERTRILLGVTKEQLAMHSSSSLQRLAAGLAASSRSRTDFFAYPVEWPFRASTETLWTYLQGEELPLDDPMNGRALVDELIHKGVSLPKPELALAQFWGFDIRRERLPTIKTLCAAPTAVRPSSGRLTHLTNRCTAVAKWLYPEQKDAFWSGLRSASMKLAWRAS